MLWKLKQKIERLSIETLTTVAVYGAGVTLATWAGLHIMQQSKLTCKHRSD